VRAPTSALGLLFSACTFSAQLPEDLGPDAGDGTPSNPNPPPPNPAGRCKQNGLTVCIEFEDMPAITDAVGNTVTAVNVTKVTHGADIAAQLGINSQLKIADSSRLDQQRLTIEMWTKPMQAPPSGGDKQVGLFDAHLQYQMNFEADLRIECRLLGGDSNVDSNAQLGLYAWHHVACTYDGMKLKVYVDGKVSACKDMNRTVEIAGTFGAAVGANMDVGPIYKNPFVGQLDNVHVYSRALTGADICTLWGNGNCNSNCPIGGEGSSWNDWHND
jgi:hypothetical protein